MPRTLIVPGVSVEVSYDVAPPLPARSGVLGAVGVVDRHASDGPVSVTSRRELLELAGPATRWSFPEALAALANGVSELVLSSVDPKTGAAATATLLDADGDAVVKLRARAVGPWANDLKARVTPTLAADGRTVRRVRIDILLGDQLLESHENLALRAGADDDLFTVINRDSQAVVAIDPAFETDLPTIDLARVPFVDGPARAATATLTRGVTPVLTLTAVDAGEAGNTISAAVSEGRAFAALPGAAAAPSLLAWSVNPGATGLRVTVSAGAGSSVSIAVTSGVVRNYTNLATVNDAVAALLTDPDVRLERVGEVLPAITVAPVDLAPTRTLEVQLEGVRTTVYRDLANATAIAAAVGVPGNSALVQVAVAAGAQLPDVGSVYLSQGRDAGLQRAYAGQNNPSPAVVVELHPAPDTDGALTRFQVRAGTTPSTVRVQAGVEIAGTYAAREDWDNLSMDPDDPRYLPAVLAQSALLRAVDTYSRSHASTFPRDTTQIPVAFTGGRMPRIDAFQAAIDALESEDAVDLVLAGLQGWKDPGLNGLAVQQALLGHAITQTDAARPRIALGSVAPTESGDVRAILDHARQVGNQRFVLVTPAGAEGAVAGLLGHLEYFQSPTFKTVAAPGVPLVRYSEADLNQLVGPLGNVCVVSERRGRGVLVVKGIATNGFQISVTRVADRATREVNAIANKFIGELNNDDARNALKQMIVATFTQMERDGALVPSVDGKSPAFVVDVYASQNDTAAGIVRIDIAVRPVRAIDYVYATIRVKN